MAARATHLIPTLQLLAAGYCCWHQNSPYKQIRISMALCFPKLIDLGRYMQANKIQIVQPPKKTARQTLLKKICVLSFLFKIR